MFLRRKTKAKKGLMKLPQMKEADNLESISTLNQTKRKMSKNTNT